MTRPIDDSVLTGLGNRDGLARSDVILVLGAQGHVFPADEAARTARLQPQRAGPSFGEADALMHRFRSQYPGVPPDVRLHVDGRARTTAETIAHLQTHLQPLVTELGRPVVLTLVTLAVPYAQVLLPGALSARTARSHGSARPSTCRDLGRLRPNVQELPADLPDQVTM